MRLANLHQAGESERLGAYNPTDHVAPDSTSVVPSALAAWSPPLSMRPLHYRPSGFRRRHVAVMLGLRQPVAEHTEREAELLAFVAAGRTRLVEVGVAEGGSAVVLRSAMAEDGELFLVDPYARRPSIQLWVARRVVAGVRRGAVTWLRSYSLEAAANWLGPIDFLHLDADHRYEAVRADWEAWTRHVVPGGLVAMHDARPIAGLDPMAGPVRLAAEVESAGGSWGLAAETDSTVVFRRTFQRRS